MIGYPEWVVLLLGVAAGFFLGLSPQFDAFWGTWTAVNGLICLGSAIVVGKYGDRQ